MTEGSTKKSRRKSKTKKHSQKKSGNSSSESSGGSAESSDEEGVLSSHVTIVNGHIDCPGCALKLTIKKDPMVYVRHATDDERKDATKASRKRWNERNKDKIRECNRLAAKRYRERKKLERELLELK